MLRLVDNVLVGDDGVADAAPDYSAEDRNRRIRAIVAASSGNLVEWFDFYIYAFCAIYFAAAFFPSVDPTGQLLQTAGVFGAGFLMRPLGGWFFGRLADRSGRKRAMLVSVLMMCFGSLMIAALPTYADAGIWAPIGLLAARLLQGLSVGGEYGTTATYMSEVALKGRRGFFSSFQYVTLIGGQLVASLVMVILQTLLTHDQMLRFGWRIPFVIGALTAIVALFLRMSLHEAARTQERESQETGSVVALVRAHPAAFFTVIGYTAGGSLIFYTFTTYMQKYLVNSGGMPIRTANYVMTASLLLFMGLQPLFGALSDRIGRRTCMMLFSGLGAIAVVPIMTALGSGVSPWVAFLLISTALAIISFYTSISGIVKAEMFPPHVRALGVGLSYALANALFGGTAEYLALTFKASGLESLFFCYVAAMMVMVFFISRRLPRQARYLYHDL
jgi:MHS family alpha-ketoglutarate permease-like MFS transporter